MDLQELTKKELLRRNYSLKTIKTYNYCLNNFLRYYNNDIKKINKQNIKDYLDKLINKNLGYDNKDINIISPVS